MKDKLNYSLLSRYRTELMGIAAIFIVIFHSGSRYATKGTLMLKAISQLSIGVEMFLLLSGIGLYFALSKKPRFSDYYKKRFLNVYVIYLIIALPLFIYHYIFIEEFNILGFLSDWTGIAFLLGKRYIYGSHGGWYVFFIMLLYAVYPLVFKVQKLLEKYKLDLIALIGFVCAFILAFYYFRNHAYSVYEKYEIALSRIPVFIIGSYCGKLVYNKKTFSAGTYITVSLGIIFYVVLSKFNIYYVDWRFDKMLLSFSVCIFLCVIFSMLKGDSINKALRFFGNMSLELYLTHNLINELMFKNGHYDTTIQYVIIVLVSILPSYFLSNFALFCYLITAEKNNLISSKRKSKVSDSSEAFFER